MLFVLWALREGGLWGLFGWHAVVNWASENLIVVGEGFGPLADALVVGIDETGRNLLTGGAVGPEASVMRSAVLGVGIAVLARWPHRGDIKSEKSHSGVPA